MIEKIIYIGYMPLTEKVAFDFYFQEVIINGFIIEYWDLTKIYSNINLKENFFKDYIKKFNCLNDVETKLKEQDIQKTIFIILFTYNGRVINIFRLFTKFKCNLLFFARGNLPSIQTDRVYYLRKILKLFDPIAVKTLLLNKYAVILKKLGIIKPYDIILSAGLTGINTIGVEFGLEKLHSKIFDINHFDFDTYKFNTNHNNLINKKYCVFLDEYLPYHPDFSLLNQKTIEPENYYNSLNNFFDKIEKKLKIEVIIAAHPKAEKYKYFNPFEGRDILFNKTCELIKFAEFSFAHVSTSINFSVLNKTPVIFLYTDDLKSNMFSYYNLILTFSKKLGSKVINIDNFELNAFEICNVILDKYDEYKYLYITSKKSETRLSTDIFIQTISEF